MTKSQKRQLRKNFIQLLIGIVLLMFSFLYLQSHPAEKDALVSGFKIMSQRISILREKMSSGSSEILERKYDLENAMKDMLKSAENTACISLGIKKEVTDLYEDFQQEKVEDLKQSYSSYRLRVIELHKILKNNCE